MTENVANPSRDRSRHSPTGKADVESHLKSMEESQCVANGEIASFARREAIPNGLRQECLGSDLLDGLNALLKASRYAVDAHRPVWDFAVETERLRTYRMSDCDFRWLIAKQYVEHQEDITLLGQRNRCFRPLDGLMFSRSSCLVLTPTGVTFVQSLCAAQGSKPFDSAILGACRENRHANHGEAIPTWDLQRLELSWNGKIVKRFKAPSPLIRIAS